MRFTWVFFFSLFLIMQGTAANMPTDMAPGDEGAFQDDEDGYNDMENDGYGLPEDDEDVDVDADPRETMPPGIASNEMSAERGGFSINNRNTTTTGPTRLVKTEGPQYIEERPWQGPSVPNDVSTMLPRKHPPVEKEIAFGQTDWNQIDLHSLTRNRIDRG